MLYCRQVFLLRCNGAIYFFLERCLRCPLNWSQSTNKILVWEIIINILFYGTKIIEFLAKLISAALKVHICGNAKKSFCVFDLKFFGAASGCGFRQIWGLKYVFRGWQWQWYFHTNGRNIALQGIGQTLVAIRMRNTRLKGFFTIGLALRQLELVQPQGPWPCPLDSQITIDLISAALGGQIQVLTGHDVGLS